MTHDALPQALVTRCPPGQELSVSKSAHCALGAASSTKQHLHSSPLQVHPHVRPPSPPPCCTQIAYLFPYVMCHANSTMFWTMNLFLAILTAGFIYEWWVRSLVGPALARRVGQHVCACASRLRTHAALGLGCKRRGGGRAASRQVSTRCSTAACILFRISCARICSPCHCLRLHRNDLLCADARS